MVQVMATGSGYKVNDFVTLVGGTVVPGYNAAIFKVTSVNGSGAITGLTRPTGTPISVYSSVPANPASVSGGSGTGGEANVTWTWSGGDAFPTGVSAP